jgi:rubrerythrin
MSNPAHFSAAEVFDLAIQTEHNGQAFYNAAAAAATDAEVKDIMRHLANAEAEHEATFRRLRTGASTQRPESYRGEEEDYMGALLRTRVLPDEETALRVVRGMTEDTQALDFALAFEKDTILFMYEMRELLEEPDRQKVAMLIGQEQMHVRLLQELKQKRQQA